MPIDRQHRTVVAGLLRQAHGWELTTPKWSAVRAAVGALAEAHRADDLAAFDAAKWALAQAGPPRIALFEPVQGAPEDLHAEIAELIHVIEVPPTDED